MTQAAATFERILRPLYETRAVAAWTAAGIWCLAWSVALDFAAKTMLALVSRDLGETTGLSDVP